MNKFRISIGRKYKNVPNKNNRANNVVWCPGWEVSLEENVRCICVAESLCYSPETFTTLFVISQLGFPCGLDGKESVNVPAMQETWA